MNKFLRYSFIALLAMVFGNVSAENVIWQEDWSSWGDYVKKVLDGVNQNYVFEGTVTNADGSFKSGTTIYNEKLAGGEAPELLVAKSGGKFIATVNLGSNSGDMTLSFKCNKNIPVEVSGGTIGENTGSGNDYSYAITGASGTLTITFNNSLSANARLDDIKLFQGQGKKAAGLSWGTSSRTVTIGANDNVFPTLQNENNLAVTYSSSDQTVATIASDGTITLIAAGKTTIKAESAETDEFEAGKAEYELTVNEATTPGEETTVANVAALNALEDKTAFTYTSDVLVVYVNGSYAYIKDDTGSSLIYDNGKTKLANLGIGSKVAANWKGKVSVYNNLFEAVPDDVLAVTSDAAVDVTYPDAAITDVVATNMNQVVVLKGVAYTAPDGKNFNITEGGVEVKGYNTFNIEIAAPEDGKTYNITGVISVYKENVQFLPIAIEEAGGGDPGIDPSATIYELPISKFAPWDGTSIEGNVITMGAGWKGGAIYVGGDMTQFDYVWIKFKNATGTPNFGITYDEWTSNADWGPVFAAVTTAMDGTGMVGIKLDKKTVMVHGNAETGGVGIGDVYAQHVQQITIQGGNSAASVEVEGIWFGTTAEFVKAGGDVPVRPEAGGALTMWEGELVYDGWGVSSTVDPKYFEVAEVGDIIYCSVKDVTADYNPIFKYQDWSDFTDIQATLAKDETHFEGKIATAEALDYLQKNGLRFQGVGFTLTKVELKVPDPSGVNTINAVKVDNGAIYNIAGQKVNAGYKGLVIKNGKKFVNK